MRCSTYNLGLFLLFFASLGLFDCLAVRAEPFDLQAGNGRHWYRGNMHTHSLWSDGDDYLDNIALWYRENGYQFLVFTDHNVLADTERWIDVEKSKGGQNAFEKFKSQFPEHVQERTNAEDKLEVRLNTFQDVAGRLIIPDEFLLIQGEEISDEFEKAPIHICASNIQEVIPPMKGGSVAETIQNNFRAVNSQREKTGIPMIAHLNHPNFGYAITAEDMMLIRGEQFFEVYNGHPWVNNQGDHLHASCDRIWDILLTGRLGEYQLPALYGLATDDSHDHHELGDRKSNPGRGWVMVLAEELSVESLIDALEAGQFYASSGVALRRIAVTPQEYSVEVEPVDGEEYEIEFIGTREGYDWSNKPVVDEEGSEVRTTHHYSDDIGETLATVKGTEANYKFKGDELYVRARVTSSAKAENASFDDGPKRAWSQPVDLTKPQ
ncbi:CehA/McbA family metallohydrolase domain-containing protein [Bythopirellula goksoeyrii]|uniref:PHP domain protein n=1 Tax=Bythopirellula goksoeyrii TaxID=1400387 RepID=A0A5B9QJ85_9BACT|nr:hypothetical protein [Bythopirellula goksoeyrii]QEG34231.1 hypothetical protein Pr1d_15040 [Bythopirellula goksoeyrii]